MIPKFRELVYFILKHKKDKVFRGMDIDDIAPEVYEAIQNDSLVYHEEKDKGITGLAILVLDHKLKTLFVKRTLCITPNASLALCCIYALKYPSYRLARNKRDRYKEYISPLTLVKRWAKQLAQKISQIQSTQTT